MREELEKYYRDNFKKLSKVYGRRAGSPEAGEDIVQEGFALALRYLDSYNPAYNNMKAWLDRVMMTAFREYRRSERMLGMSEELDEELIEQDEQRLFEGRIVDEIKNLIGKKPTHIAEILDLYYFKSYTPLDICKVTASNMSTVLATVSRFREEVKSLYEEGSLR